MTIYAQKGNISKSTSSIVVEVHYYQEENMETYSDSDKTTSNAIHSDIQCEQSCFYCNEKDIKKLNLCEICQCVYYCSKDHQNIHLAGR